MIRLHNIHYSYPDPSGIKTRQKLCTYALKSVSISIAESERVALLGANGSGKTTLLHVINGLVRPSDGEYHWKNAPVRYSKPFLNNLRRSIATVFQDPEDQLFAGTVYEDVSFGPMNQSLSKSDVHQVIMNALDGVGMTAEAHLPLHMLSFGQKKRVALAGALAMQPEVLLLDEPTAGLDPQSEIRLLEILESKQKQKTAILFSTHDVDLAFEWAEKIVILFRGEVVLQGVPQDIIKAGLDLARWDLRNPRCDHDHAVNVVFTNTKHPLNPTLSGIPKGLPQGDLKNTDQISDRCLQSPPAGDLEGAVSDATQHVNLNITTSGECTGVKAFLAGATSSGTGKTSICSGLGLALRRRGLKVQFCKVGPDYIDPTWLSMAGDNQCINLDVWMHGRDGVRERFQKACAGADICIIEGVMGLYDGVDSGSNDGSSADVARLLGVPVVLLADAKGCARSFAAVVHGFANFQDAPKFIGCIANRVGSSRHGSMIHQSLQNVPNAGTFFASVPDQAFPSIDNRHLGLHMAADHPKAMEVITGIADVLEKNINLDDLIQSLPCIPCEISAQTASGSVRPLCRLAIAKDEAFCFYYPEWVMALESAGAEVVPFSPLHDQKMPDNCDGLLLGGGYPELYCKKLSENNSMLQAIRNHALTGKLIYAECGGLMYVSQGIRCTDGAFPMLGIMPAWTKLQDRLSRLGYVQATLRKDCMLGTAEDILRGHEFHYSQLESEPAGWECIYSCTTPKGGNSRLEGWSKGNLFASYIHLPMDVFPKAIKSLIQTACKGIS